MRGKRGEDLMANERSITRRTALTTAAAGAAALGAADAMAQSGARKTFVLIHGAYHGGWCWKKVTDILERGGHKVYAPSLTGLADRSHLLGKDTSLDIHITDIVNLFKWEDITNACLVPHSYGGWPASGALEQIGDRVSSIVWLDAFMPKDGERALDTMSVSSRKALDEAMARGEATRNPPKANAYSISEKDYDWINSKLTAQPNAIQYQTIKLTGALQKVAKKTYIRAPKYQNTGFDKALAECKADPTWTTYGIENSHHDVMIDQPEWLVEILLKHS
jgi:pimeloyl-ACP methyl ester carboxylesterase